MVLLLEPGRARKVDEIEARPKVLGNIFYVSATYVPVLYQICPFEPGCG